MASFIKIALRLRLFIGNHKSIKPSEENEGESSSGSNDFIHLSDEKWKEFYKNTLLKYKISWTKKLEDYEDQKTEEVNFEEEKVYIEPET